MMEDTLAALCAQPILPLFNCPQRGRRWEGTVTPGTVVFFVICVIFLVISFRSFYAGGPEGDPKKPVNSTVPGVPKQLLPLSTVPILTSSSNSTAPPITGTVPPDLRSSSGQERADTGLTSSLAMAIVCGY
ncbi:hypothetical protein HD806DRAFT_391716 [Xylariaceae sp. AK1471]|nr:hypothetical protein HD806DRAFT_391716 [Xylariaceae sp. AK1471]